MQSTNNRLRLTESLALAARYLRSMPEEMAASPDDDPLHLPPLLTPAREPALSSETLRKIAAMFLQSELEQAGIIAVVELLAEARFRLEITSTQAMQKLEEFARRSSSFYNRAQREMVFARLFGIGRGATSERGSSVNSGFQQLFAAFCNALSNYASGFSLGRLPAPTADALLRQAALAVVLNLAPRQFGNTLVAGSMIGDQLKRAIEVLSDAGIQTHFQARGFWDVLRRILGEHTPDLGRLVTRGQTGLHLLNWLAGVLDNLNDSNAARPLVAAQDPVFVWAAQWLQATGLAAAGVDAAVRRVA